MNIHPPKEDKQIANKYMENSSMSLVIRKMQIKIICDTTAHN